MMTTIARWMLLPVSLLYAVIVWLRNRLYDWEVLKSRSFPLPVVVIGNLAVGGAGKSPMAEYVLRRVGASRKVALLSRGYGRKTKGFRYVKTVSAAEEVGDEPLQIKRKFPENTVVVCEDRCRAIDRIADDHDAVLLDDAFQHRKLRPSFSILLFALQSIRKPMLPLPTGNFRDAIQESRRADVIVVTKCPPDLDSQTRFDIQAKFHRHGHAPVFFSETNYGDLTNAVGQTQAIGTLKDRDVLLVTGIANPSPLLSFLKPKVASLRHLAYADHHTFSRADIARITTSFSGMASTDKLIVTTEKDFQRLPGGMKKDFPLFYIPIRQAILFGQAPEFDAVVSRAFGF